MPPSDAPLPGSIRITLLVGILGIALGAVGIQSSQDPGWIRFFDNLHWTSGTLAAATISWLSYKRANSEDAKWLYWISLGMIGYAIGQIIWDIQIATGYSHFPSPSDLFYLWLGPCITVALLKLINLSASKSNKKTILLDTATLTVATLMLILMIYLPKRGDIALLPMLVLIAYPVTLFAATITGLSMIPALRLRLHPYLLIFLGSICVTAFSWMNWNFMSLNGAIIDGDWSNVSFSIAILLAGFSLARLKIESDHSPAWDRKCEGVTRLIPLAAVIISFVALSEAEDQNNPYYEGFAFLGTFIVVLLAVLRYGHLMQERDLLLTAQQALIRSKEELALERIQNESELRIAATAFESQESIMITDANSIILRVNQAFTENTGYSAEEIVGKTPRILHSGHHNADFYHAMWETINQTGVWQGEIWDKRKNGEVYPKWLNISAVKNQDGIVTHYVGSHIDITERKRAENEIQHLGLHDALTNLPNRKLLMDRLRQTLTSSTRTHEAGALLLIDLDNFKNLNDTRGHEIGNQLLQLVAQRLQFCVRDEDTVARMGGDEFVVMLENLNGQAIEAAAQVETVGEKILASLAQSYQLAEGDFFCTGSIGAILFKSNTLPAEELMKQADIAMYQAKQAGRNTLRFFDPQVQTSISARVSLESELRKALEKQQFCLYYQIQVNSSRQPLGAEALIRWIHPERGMVSPLQFIPLAEDTGFILPIGLWVLETACAQIKTWENDISSRDLVLAINVSAKQFHQHGFVETVKSVVQKNAINPNLLKLELTESMLLNQVDNTIAIMTELKEFGILFSLDDFGTGYSSLQYLKRLPLDQLKIDQSFVRDITIDKSDMAIVKTIIAMAQSLEMDVIAEGVETEEQLQFLIDNGCINHQGYLFSRPVPIEQFEALIRSN